MTKIDRDLLMLTEHQGRAVYLGHKQLHQVHGITSPNWSSWLTETGRMINPDVVIGPPDDPVLRSINGWYGPRVLDWMSTIGRIDANDEVVRLHAGGYRPQLSDQDAEQIRTLAAEGVSTKDIAEQFELAWSTVHDYINRVPPLSYPDPDRWQVTTQRYRSASELADALQISPKLVHTWLGRGKIPPGDIIVGDPRNPSGVRQTTRGWSQDSYQAILDTYLD